MAKATPPKEPTSFNSSAALGSHPSSPPSLASAHKKPPKMTDAEQGAAFEKAARDLECDPDDERFMGILRALAKPKR